MDDRRRSARRSLARARLALLVCVLGLGALLSPAAALDVGDLVPPLALRTAEGRAFTLQAELGEHPTLLSFVSPRCTPCRDSRPALEQLCRTYGTERRLAIVSVMLGAETSREGPGSGPLHAGACAETLVLGDDATATRYGIFGTPVFLLVGRQGTVLWKHVGRLAPGQVDAALGPEIAALEPLTR